ncbi:MAG: putative sensor protein [Acidobacteria bacterium]|jgi:HD-GYP domain-containing protein (c-di-GMP phosphodiesterase class II)|nr:putative sensor protein [Acidobacteriota bacterium]
MPQEASPGPAIPRQASTRELATLLEVSKALAASLDLEVVMQTAIESAVAALELETGAIYLLDGDELRLGATTPPLPADFPDALRRARLADHAHLDASIRDGRPLFLADAASAPLTPAERAVVEARRLRSLLFVPLLLRGRALGAFIVGSQDGTRAIGEQQVDLCRMLAAEIALAVTNAQLFESVERARNELVAAYDATLLGWSLALEMRDEETNGHTERVTRATLELAAAMGLPATELPHVRRGALLHDIGKMVVPDRILHKTGALSPEEWEIMRRHPEHARAFLAKIDYLGPALEIPYCHHERWDGEGYPRGLRGEEIPLAARIFAVVDVFDALTSDRPYRAARSRSEALDYIREQSGRHFDPAVVSAFLAHAKPLGS